MEPLYDRFADLYAAGPYPRYTTRMIEVFPDLLARLEVPTSGRMLDMACGEGTFAVAQALQGWQVTGVDQSERMLEYARKKASSANVPVVFRKQDMRSLDFSAEFDVVTCWFDSLNYLLHLSDLADAFDSAYRALKPGGWFLFDMNTIYGLAYTWQQMNVYIQQDDENLLEIHSTAYDYETQIATLQITGFVRLPEVGLWERIDEIHRERGYPLDQIRGSLENAGFEVRHIYGSLQDFELPDSESPRAWFICQKAG